MKINIGRHEFTESWDGVLYKAWNADFVIIYRLNLRFSQSKTKETLVQSESNISRRAINNE